MVTDTKRWPIELSSLKEFKGAFRHCWRDADTGGEYSIGAPYAWNSINNTVNHNASIKNVEGDKARKYQNKIIYNWSCYSILSSTRKAEMITEINKIDYIKILQVLFREPRDSMKLRPMSHM